MFTGFLAAAATFLTLDIARAAQRRIVPVHTLALVLGSWLGFWVLTGNSEWPAFIGGSLDVARGYSGAMQVAGPARDVWLSILVAVGAVGLLTWGYASPAADRNATSTVAVGVSAGLYAFLSLKAGIVRQDGHVWTRPGPCSS